MEALGVRPDERCVRAGVRFRRCWRPSNPVRAKTSLTKKENTMPTNGTLSYEVFVAEPIPQNVMGLLPNGEHHMFSPLATTLIYSKNDAVLVDPPLTMNQAKAVGDWVEASGKKLTYIFATHGQVITGSQLVCWPSGSAAGSWPPRARSNKCTFTYASAKSSGTSCGPGRSRLPRSPLSPCPTTASPSRVTTSSSSRLVTATPTTVACSTCPISAWRAVA